MGLPARQQKLLDQIEQVLQAADPRLKSMFGAFARMTPGEASPAVEVIPVRPVRQAVMIFVTVIGLLSVLVLSILATGRACPGLPSDQAVASAAVRYAACSKSTDAWSRGGR